VRVTCHALEPGGGLRPEAELAAVAGWRAGGGPYWVDLSGDRPEEALGWLGGLGLDPAVLDALQIGDDSPRILPLAESVFLAYPVAAADDAGSAGRFPCLCLERLVVTLHDAGDRSRRSSCGKARPQVSSARWRRYESAQQDETNRRLGLLTILSAIFMPLTLIVGIYGINFDVMPELHWRYGHPGALAAMAAIAAGLYWHFRSRGWLR